MRVAAAFLLTRLMQSLVFGVTADDPLTFCTVPLLLLFIAFAGHQRAGSARGPGRSGGVFAVRLGLRVCHGDV